MADVESGSATPVGDAEFGAWMAALGPFEAEPRLAVAVSGGSDSIALAVLADRWCRACDGSVLALTVDHGLREGAAAEAADAGRILAREGVAQHVLRWEGAKPAAGIQAAARAARYRLLEDACAAAGILHLLVAHHADDQAETLLLRLGHGSGPFGLAGMSAIRERRRVRVVRPLLTATRARLRATLETSGIPWLDDPSNRNPAFARTGARDLLQAAAPHAPAGPALAASARRLGRARQAAEGALAGLIAAAVTLRPEGYALVDAALFSAAPADARLRLLAAVTGALGGGDWPPRDERVERFDHRMRDAGFRQHTLGGCLVRAVRGAFLVCREPEVAPTLTVAAGERLHWDGRFDIAVPAGSGEGLTVGPFGAARRDRRRSLLPASVRAGLPVLRDVRGIVAAAEPLRADESVDPAAIPSLSATFRPRRPLMGPGFALV
ncbi:tRNA(Ile)-lysidine synthase [Constrictibacter sp. MBR-5]|uniref:tRNA lysidine(34) synthetase TilS n=1 Tax=Constrictibacter sp. MBR-5 TaxID=3156467 RepID=UPI0033976609